MMTDIFITLSVLAIAAGGIISAFTARKPSRLSAWLSAYLVLVVGLVQLGLVESWRGLGAPQATVAGIALALYNAGSAAVICGTIFKTKIKYSLLVVKAGGGCLAIAMAMLLYTVKGSQASKLFIGFIMLVLTILISMPIGIGLASKRRKKVNDSP